jgi:nitrogen-specific signal transduction histidine kinase
MFDSISFRSSFIRIISFVCVLGFVGVTLWETNELIQQIEEEERLQMELWALAQQELAANTDINQPVEPLTFKILTAKNSIPMIVVNSENKLLFSNNIDNQKLAQDSLGYIQELIDDYTKIHAPIEITYQNSLYQKMYYGQSKLISQLRYYPIAFFVIVFLLIGLIVAYYKSAQSALESKLWTGMAKETAHQLGTPISSLMGWLTILEQQGADLETTAQIKKDITRLEIISARFSKIGSIPNKKEILLSELIDELLDYMRVRMPKSVDLAVKTENEEKKVQLNPTLMMWVLENLIKNSIDAIRGEGEITLLISWNDKAVITLRDSGGGIPKNLQNKIFIPGETTKKRGWGLGLSLAKRIVEEQHNGKLRLVESSTKGTVFEIELPFTQKPR